MSICLYVYMSICLYVYMSICLYVYMSICLYGYMGTQVHPEYLSSHSARRTGTTHLLMYLGESANVKCSLPIGVLQPNMVENEDSFLLVFVRSGAILKALFSYIA
jgi:hypothetical protein